MLYAVKNNTTFTLVEKWKFGENGCNVHAGKTRWI